MLLWESPHFHNRCPTCLVANLKFCNPLSFFLITQIESTRKCCKTHFQNRSRIHSLIFPAHTPDKQQHPHPGPCAVSLRLLCASLTLYLLTLHSSLTDASREQSQQVLLCSNYPITSYLSDKINPLLTSWRPTGSGPSLDLISTSCSFSHTCLLTLPWTQTLSCPCTFGGSTAWKDSPPNILVDIPSCPSHLYSQVTFPMRPTVHPSNTATFSVPTHLYAGSPSSEH